MDNTQLTYQRELLRSIVDDSTVSANVTLANTGLPFRVWVVDEVVNEQSIIEIAGQPAKPKWKLILRVYGGELPAKDPDDIDPSQLDVLQEWRYPVGDGKEKSKLDEAYIALYRRFLTEAVVAFGIIGHHKLNHDAQRSSDG
jgi:hypothetical protein